MALRELLLYRELYIICTCILSYHSQCFMSLSVLYRSHFIIIVIKCYFTEICILYAHFYFCDSAVQLFTCLVGIHCVPYSDIFCCIHNASNFNYHDCTVMTLLSSYDVSIISHGFIFKQRLFACSDMTCCLKYRLRPHQKVLHVSQKSVAGHLRSGGIFNRFQ